MKILGGHDYYDSASIYGIDTDTIFVRKEIKFKKHPFWYHDNHNYNTIHLVDFEIVVASNIYRGVAHKQVDKKDTFYYTLTDFKEAPFYERLARYRKRTIYEDYFSRSISTSQLEWLIDNKVVLGYTIDNEFVANNCNLRNFELYRILPPVQAHQQIYSWISGVLTSSKPMIELSNNNKIVKAGFDTKTSFRHPV
jgi:hypothetical protein